MTRLVDNHTDWANPDHYIVEEGILKMILGFDPDVFGTDNLCEKAKNCGFSSHKFNKADCISHVTKAVENRQTYDMMEPGSNTGIDSAGLHCRLLNIVFSDKFAT
jgi:hypothetical protein